MDANPPYRHRHRHRHAGACPVCTRSSVLGRARDRPGALRSGPCAGPRTTDKGGAGCGLKPARRRWRRVAAPQRYCVVCSGRWRRPAPRSQHRAAARWLARETPELVTSDGLKRRTAPQLPCVPPACVCPMLRGHLRGPWCLRDRPLRGDDSRTANVADGSLAARRASCSNHRWTPTAGMRMDLILWLERTGERLSSVQNSSARHTSAAAYGALPSALPNALRNTTTCCHGSVATVRSHTRG